MVSACPSKPAANTSLQNLGRTIIENHVVLGNLYGGAISLVVSPLLSRSQIIIIIIARTVVVVSVLYSTRSNNPRHAPEDLLSRTRHYRIYRHDNQAETHDASPLLLVPPTTD